MGMTTTALLQQQDLGQAYQDLYDILKKMYWEASTVDSKDEVYGAMEEVGAIIDDIDGEDLASDTQKFLALLPRITNANVALESIRADVTRITKNISTAASAVAAITKIVSLIPK